MDNEIASIFRAALPEMVVVSDPANCLFASADLSGPADMPAAAILRPADTDALQALVRVARAARIALYPRGGGWSYTAGYRPEDDRSAIVDTSLLQSITIDHAAGTVEAGSGVTWSKLYDTLEAAGLRVTSFGPLSGVGATVGWWRGAEWRLFRQCCLRCAGRWGNLRWHPCRRHWRASPFDIG